MLILDKILLSPLTATLWAARQVHNAMQQEQAAEGERITAELSDLYMMLETGRLSEAQFSAREKELLDRLDRIEERENNSREKSRS
jgi:hypothetical protein